MSATIKEIALELGISPATVSLALNGSPVVSEKTRAKVLDLAAKVDYLPNNFGRGLQSRRSNLIGYVLEVVHLSFFSSIMQSIGFEAAQHNYGLLTAIISTGGTDALLQSQIKILLEKKIDGLILSLPYSRFAPFREKVEKNQIPFLFCSSYCENKVSSVLTDNFSGGYKAAKYLLERGHRSLLSSDLEPFRHAGNRKAAEEYPDAVIHPFHTPEEAVAQTEHDRIDAILAYTDMQAIEIIYLLKQRGIRVPDDISVIGFDDIPLAGRPEFMLTTIRQQQMELGKIAVHGILAMIHGEKQFHRQLEPELIVRNTVK